MKEFNIDDNYGLEPIAFEWLKRIGLLETAWFLDTEYLISRHTYEGWFNVG